MVGDFVGDFFVVSFVFDLFFFVLFLGTEESWQWGPWAKRGVAACWDNLRDAFVLHSRLPCGDVVWLRNSAFSYTRALHSMWGRSELWDRVVHTLEYLKWLMASVWMGPSVSPMGFLGEPGTFFFHHFTMGPFAEDLLPGCFGRKRF